MNSFPDCDNEYDNDNEKPPPIRIFGFNPDPVLDVEFTLRRGSDDSVQLMVGP
jgi:hypothetical protein